MTKVRVLAAAVSLALGCGTAASRPIVEFPSQARLAELEAKPVTLPPLQTAEVPPEGWPVEPAGDPADAADGLWTPRSAWEKTFAREYSALGHSSALTRAMACAARELGRFYLAKQAPAPEPLQQFLTAACGVFAPSVGLQTLKANVPETDSDDVLLARWKNQIFSDLVARLLADARHVGFWFGRAHGRAVVAAAFESTPVDLQPLSPAPDANGDLTIEGRLDGAAEYIAGYANQGRFGVAACLVDPSVPRPEFRITCRMAPGDDMAWMQVVYAPPRSVLAQPIVQVLARRDLQRPLIYLQPAHAASQPVTDPATFGPAVLAALNAVRGEARLPAVRLADGQSAAATRVARHYFAAALGPSEFADMTSNAVQEMNTIALGLLAGWQVVGTIRDGTFFSALVPHTRDAGRWVDYALAMPLGRHALMAPDIDEVALGPALFDSPPAIGAVACGYRFHHSNDHTADVNQVLSRITSARQRSNLPPPARLKGMDAVLRRWLGGVQQGEWTPKDALQASLNDASSRYNASMQGLVVEATSLDALEIPAQVLSQANLQLEIGVTHYKPPGAAWAQLVIVVVFVSASGVAI
ncbi:MAG TPA: hypothetical protein VN903_20085 [Polyangia bacterium]|jgi:hypothetical protein|nr:hypothetical protein [Polyangia bacterium]